MGKLVLNRNIPNLHIVNVAVIIRRNRHHLVFGIDERRLVEDAERIAHRTVSERSVGVVVGTGHFLNVRIRRIEIQQQAVHPALYERKIPVEGQRGGQNPIVIDRYVHFKDRPRRQRLLGHDHPDGKGGRSHRIDDLDDVISRRGRPREQLLPDRIGTLLFETDRFYAAAGLRHRSVKRQRKVFVGARYLGRTIPEIDDELHLTENLLHPHGFGERHRPFDIVNAVADGGHISLIAQNPVGRTFERNRHGLESPYLGVVGIEHQYPLVVPERHFARENAVAGRGDESALRGESRRFVGSVGQKNADRIAGIPCNDGAVDGGTRRRNMKRNYGITGRTGCRRALRRLHPILSTGRKQGCGTQYETELVHCRTTDQ